VHIPTDDSFWLPPEPETLETPPRGRVLCFAPHPDDESIGPGGTLCLHRAQGDPVRVVVASDGRAGDPDGHFDPAGLAERRRQESRSGLAELGVEDAVFWGLPDSCVINENDINMVADLAWREVASFAPDLVYAPWEGEANSDHRALYCAVVRGLGRGGFRGALMGYEIWSLMVPDRVVNITGVADRKRRALGCYTTQLLYTDLVHSTLGLNAARSMLFNHSRGYGEAFRRIELPR
jgi:LmbE family N-acetylglucosaminyl deacetylase